MKKIGVLALAAGVIFFVSGLAMADRWKNESGKGPVSFSRSVAEG